MKSISIVEDFKTNELTNRDKHQRDGTFTGVEFREKFLKELNNEEGWKDDSTFAEIDFTNVTKLGPSWANEVFAYYTQFAKPDIILKKIKIKNLSRVKETIIEVELSKGYRGK